ncbi:MAG: glycine cleavage system protein T, partial [Proteobacteria bacterium]|nr:glycine cleavage system protein T [Pseudomonadota bacterium]
EPDASPLQLQGPRSLDVMKSLFGEDIATLKYYWLRHLTLDGMELVVSRTGWSSELGYEIYLQDGSQGSRLWNKIMAAGEAFGLKPGHTSTIRRIEGGMLSYHADMDINTNPFELGLDRLVALDAPHDFIGKSALQAIRAKGPSRRQVGLIIDGAPLAAPNTKFWPVIANNTVIGKVTSAVYSPRLEQNIALAMLGSDAYQIGAEVTVDAVDGVRQAKQVEMPFYDPKKNIAKS